MNVVLVTTSRIFGYTFTGFKDQVSDSALGGMSYSSEPFRNCSIHDYTVTADTSGLIDNTQGMTWAVIKHRFETRMAKDRLISLAIQLQPKIFQHQHQASQWTMDLRSNFTKIAGTYQVSNSGEISSTFYFNPAFT